MKQIVFFQKNQRKRKQKKRNTNKLFEIRNKEKRQSKLAALILGITVRKLNSII